jgi:hypothetical protein
MQQYFDAALHGLFTHLASEMATVSNVDHHYRAEVQQWRIEEAQQAAALIATVSRFIEGGYTLDEFYSRLFPCGFTNKESEWAYRELAQQKQNRPTDASALP